MSLSGYWTSNMIFDILLAYVPIGLIIMLTIIFDRNLHELWVLFMLYPLAIVPYTYVWSFVFTSEINSQIFTMILHFISGGLLAVIVYVLQIIPATM